jgi:hypothetical protein
LDLDQGGEGIEEKRGWATNDKSLKYRERILLRQEDQKVWENTNNMDNEHSDIAPSSERLFFFSSFIAMLAELLVASQTK